MATTKKTKPQEVAKLTDTSNPMFWLSVFLSDMQELNALESLHVEMICRNRQPIICLALSGAVGRQFQRVMEVVRFCKDEGLLLFCFEKTTALQGGAA